MHLAAPVAAVVEVVAAVLYPLPRQPKQVSWASRPFWQYSGESQQHHRLLPMHELPGYLRSLQAPKRYFLVKGRLH
jgi:hypothetical protein